MSSYEEVEILLVEDNPKDAEMTQRALRKHNFGNKLHWVKDGAEALDYMFCRGAYAGRDMTRTPRLVLLDIKMPKVDGFEVLSRLKQHPVLKTVPVIVMTAKATREAVIQGLARGADGYITKPFDVDIISSAIKSVLGLK